jgi:hypothetical protein
MLYTRPTRPAEVATVPSHRPIANPAGAAGYSAPASIGSDFSKLSDKERRRIQAFVRTVMKDPLLKRRLSNRIYELLLEELQQSRERQINYGGRF